MSHNSNAAATPTPGAAPGAVEESPWVDEPDYPHRIENHVKVYLHLEESSTGPQWAVSPISVDGYPLDGVEDGHYCDYEGHPLGARPDWDRLHLEAANVALPTAEELLPLLAAALSSSVGGLSVEQRRMASDLIAEHGEWRSRRADLSAGETAGDFPASSDWHHSDDAGCDLAERAVALLTELIDQPAPTAAPVDPPGAAAALQRAILQPLAAGEAPPQPGRGTSMSPRLAGPGL